MIRHHLYVFLGLTALAVPVSAAEKDSPPKLSEGTWRIAVYESGVVETSVGIIKTEKAGSGSIKASVIAAAPFFKSQGGELKVDSVEVDGKMLKLTLDTPGGDWKIQTPLTERKDKSLAGSLDLGGFLLPVLLVPTDMTELTEKNFQKAGVDLPLAKDLFELNEKLQELFKQAQTETDADKKKEIQKQIGETSKQIQEKSPKLNSELLEKNPDNPLAIDAALKLIRSAGANKSSMEDVKKWVASAEKTSAEFGPAIEDQTKLSLAVAIGNVPDGTDYALEYTQGLEKNLSDKDSASKQMKVLKALQTAYKKANKTDEAKAIDARIEKLDELLDKEYLATMPPYKPQQFEGRKGASKRVVVMELFTGAQCPPCVAADVGFDGLEKTYKPTDVVLLQYHLHIPGPDPLTNADTEARQSFYKVQSTPTMLFNGKAASPGGGGMGRGKAKYKEFRKEIDSLLEDKEDADLAVTAKRSGNKIDISADVKGLKDPDGDKKLRFVLVEEAVHYVGGNGLRYHHQVVRALPGGAEGFALKEKDSKQTASVDLEELRKKLKDYLDEYAKGQPFSSDKRPMELKYLKVIALIQDDKTKEILQAQQVDVPEEGGDK